MRCKYCGVEIDDNAKVCPLCHEKLDGYDETKPTVYPHKNTPVAKKKNHFTFNNLYWAIALPIFLICVTVDYLATPGIQWCWLVLLAEAYAFLFVANTIKSNSSISLKIVVQTIMVFLVVTAAIWIFSVTLPEINPEYIVLNYALPIALGIGNIVLFVFAIINVKKRPSLLVDSIFILLTGYIPIIMFWCKTTDVLWLAVTVALISAVAHLCCIAFWRDEIKDEIQKKFHL